MVLAGYSYARDTAMASTGLTRPNKSVEMAKSTFLSKGMNGM
jgi:hypothetical protein